MNYQDRRLRLWRKRSTALLSSWPDMKRGRGEALHQVRVASRRIREALPVLFAGRRPKRLRKTRRLMRRITRLLGPIRELDVALGLLGELQRKRTAPRPAIQYVKQQIVAERRLLRRKMVERLESVDIAKLNRRITEVVRDDSAAPSLERHTRRREGQAQSGSPVPGSSDPRWRALLAARVARRAASLRTAIERAGALYFPDRLHVVRVSLKKLRYALELVREADRSRARNTIKALKGVQDRLGRLHDLEVLLARTRAALAAPPPPPAKLPEGLDALAQTLENECRQLHAAYVARRARLLEICDMGRHQLRDALSRPRPRPARVLASSDRSSAARPPTAAERARVSRSTRH